MSLWPCFECTQEFSTSEDLQKHLNEHENIAPPNGLNTSVSVRNYSKTSGQTSRTSGHISDQTSGQKSKRIKVILPQKDPVSKSGKQHRCPICPRVFDRPYSLQRHVALHKCDKKFNCDECHAKYSLKFNLNRHKRKVHNNDPKGHHIRCEICGLWFRVSATHRIHCYSHLTKLNQNKIVNSEDDLKCPECSAQFGDWESHVTHAGTHGHRVLPPPQPFQELDISMDTGSIPNGLRKPHKCELCYKSFSTEERLAVRILLNVSYMHGSLKN